MERTQPAYVPFLVVASIVLAAAGFTLFGILLKIHLLYYETSGYALAGLVAALGFGLIVSRALADPRPVLDEGEGPDRRLQMRSLGLGASFLVGCLVTASNLEYRQPDADVASVFYGLSLGSALVFSILLLRRIRPPRPAPPLETTIEAIFGDALEPAHAEVLKEQVEAGELDLERLSNAGYDEIARILAARGHSFRAEKSEWEKKVERQRQRIEQRGHRHEAHRPVPPDRSPGRQQRGAR